MFDIIASNICKPGRTTWIMTGIIYCYFDNVQEIATNGYIMGFAGYIMIQYNMCYLGLGGIWKDIG